MKGGAADTKTQNHFVEKGTWILTAAKCQQTNITKLANETLKKLVARMNADLDYDLICNEQPNIAQKSYPQFLLGWQFSRALTYFARTHAKHDPLGKQGTFHNT